MDESLLLNLILWLPMIGVVLLIVSLLVVIAYNHVLGRLSGQREMA